MPAAPPLPAVGRRIRRNYFWILSIQTLAYVGKLVVHPTPVESFSDFVHRADIGPLPGEAVLGLGLLYGASWFAIGVWSIRADRRKFHGRAGSCAMG